VPKKRKRVRKRRLVSSVQDGITVGITVTVYLMPSIAASLLDILDPDAAPIPQALSRLLDAAQKPRVIFELIVEPFILRRETYQHTGWFAVAGNDDLLAFGFAQKPGEVVFDSRASERVIISEI
jgi:hypothetical protein